MDPNEYSYLDDVPFSVRRNLQHLQSPTPSHFSRVSDTSSPDQKQVMSPSALPSSPQPLAASTQLQQQQQQQQTASAVQATRMHVDASSVSWQSITQMSFPLDQLGDLQASVTLDQSVLEDVHAALLELSSRIQHRTSLLGSVLHGVGGATRELQAGCIALEARVTEMQQALLEQRDALDRLHRAQLQDMQEIRAKMQSQTDEVMTLQGHVRDGLSRQMSEVQALRMMFEEAQHEHAGAQSAALDASIQRDAMLTAKQESLQTRVDLLSQQVQELESTLKGQGARIIEHQAILHAPRSGGEDASLLGPTVQALSERVDRELAKLTAQHETLAARQNQVGEESTSGDALGSELTQLQHMMEQVCERLGNIEVAPANQPGVPPGLQQVEVPSTQDGVEEYQLSPNILDPPVQPTQSPVHDSWAAWHQDTGDLGFPVISEPPPLDPELSKVAASAIQGSSVKGMSEASSKIQWKVLGNMPSIEFGAQTPWELGMTYNTWKRQVSTVAGTACLQFQKYVDKCFQDAEYRYQQKAGGQVPPTLVGYEAFPEEYSGRFVIQLLKILPERIKAPAIEGTQAALHPASILEELVAQVQPGGHEEQASLTKFVRSLDAVNNATDAISTLRRWRLARSRVQSLGLPSAAPFELLKGLYTLVSRLEKKHDALRTRLSICRLEPAVQLGHERGVEIVLEQIDRELRLIAADEATKANASGHSDPFANKGLAKGNDKGKGKGGDKGDKKKQVCPFLSKPGGCTFGDRCFYKHPEKPQNPPNPNPNLNLKSDQQKQRKCVFHKRKSGCKLGDACPYKHDGPSGASKAEAPKALVGAGKDNTSTQAKAAAKPKAKASAICIAHMARSTDRNVDSSEGEGVDSSDAVALSSGGLVSSDSTPSLESELPESSDSEVVVHELPPVLEGNLDDPWWIQQLEDERDHDRPSCTYYLLLDADEYVRWRAPGIVNSNARRQFRLVTTPDNVAHVIRHCAQTADHFPVEDEPISSTQSIVRIDASLVTCIDGVAREVWVAWAIDVETAGEVFMAVVYSPHAPHVRDHRLPASASEAIFPRTYEEASGSGGSSSQAQNLTGTPTVARPVPPVVIPAKAPTVAPPPGYGPRQGVSQPAPKASSTAKAPAGTSRASQASHSMDACGEVLLDTGANEVVSTRTKFPVRAAHLDLCLANGETVEARRSREGEVVVQGPHNGNFICGVNRLIQIGCAFSWCRKNGPRLELPDELNNVVVSLQLHNGLPFMPYAIFRKLRPLMTRWWKASCNKIGAVTASGGQEETLPGSSVEAEGGEVRFMTAVGLEEIHELCAHADVSRNGDAGSNSSQPLQGSAMQDAVAAEEAWAAELLAKGPKHLTYDAILGLIRKCSLKPQIKHRPCIDGTDHLIRTWMFGMWTHGGTCGLSCMMCERPQLTRVLVAFMKKVMPALPFTTLIVNDNLTFLPHKDTRNLVNSRNGLVCLTSPRECTGGGLWMQDEHGSEARLVKPNVEMLGHVHDIRRRPLEFDGRVFHGTESWEGDRVTISVYSGGGVLNLSPHDRATLIACGFPLPSEAMVDVPATPCGSEPLGAHHLQVLCPNPHAPATAAATNNSMPPTKELSDLHNSDNDSVPSGTELDEGHRDFWEDVCEAQARVDGDQDWYGASRVCFGEIVEISDGDECMSLDPEDLDLAAVMDRSEEFPEEETYAHKQAPGHSFEDFGARGTLKPHRRLKAEDFASGCLSIDIAGPYKSGICRYKYMLVCAFSTPDHGSLYFARPLQSRLQQGVLAATKDVIAQIGSMTGTVPPVVRLHSDNGKELVTKAFAEALEAISVFKTTTVPYHPQQNGKAERAIRDLKERSLKYLLKAGAPTKLWPFAMIEASIVQRAEVLNMKVPKGQPTPGTAVVIDKRAPEPFEPKVERAVYLCQDDHTSRGALCLVTRNGVESVVRARMPTRLPGTVKQWKTHTTPLGDLVWVSDQGDIRDAEHVRDLGQDLGLLTLEEREYGPGHAGGFDFIQAAGPHVAGAARANQMITTSTKQYQVLPWDMEEEAQEVERELWAASEIPAAAKVRDTQVFFQGTGKEQQIWLSALQKELESMADQGVFTRLRKSDLRTTLGLGKDEPWPEIIPTTLVITEKPDVNAAASGTNSAQDAAIEASQAWLPKVRLCACGNYETEAAKGDAEYTSNNAGIEVVRMLISETAQRQNWCLGALDVSCAFLNAVIEGPACVMRPPPVLVRLGLAEQDEVWWAHKSIYGRRKSPKEWEQLRDSTITGRIIEPPKGSTMPKLKYVGMEGVAGVWKVVDAATEFQVFGLVVSYVDDCLMAAESEILEMIARDISSIWKVKCQGLLAPPGVQPRKITDAQGHDIPWKDELTFLGLQISTHDTGIRVSQSRWIAQDLRQRGYLHLAGAVTLPNIDDFGKLPPMTRDAQYQQTLKDTQGELGSLLWVAIRSRPDIAAIVGAMASQATITPNVVLAASKQVWRYLRATWNQCMTYGWGRQGKQLWCSGDASFAPTGGRSRSGVVIQWGSHILAWKSERQKLTAFSVAEAELEASALALERGVAVQTLLAQFLGADLSAQLRTDNTADLITLTKSEFRTLEMRTRHFALRAAWSRDVLKAHGIEALHVSGQDLIADALTKALGREKLRIARERLSLCA